ncbi:NTP transferase domain-containing protein, partial [candidate division KSB1 bacterium]
MSPAADNTAAVVLAAGRSSRMGAAKATLPWKNTTFLGHILAVLEGSNIRRRAVVLGPDLENIQKKVDLTGIDLLRNPDVDRGQLSSLWIALDWAETNPGTEALLVCLVDHPDITSDLIAKLVDRFRKVGKPIVIPTHQGQRGHPTVFARETFASLKAAPLETGARTVLTANPHWIDELPVDHSGVLKGANTPDEL